MLSDFFVNWALNTVRLGVDLVIWTNVASSSSSSSSPPSPSPSSKVNVVKKDGVWAVDGRPRETVQILSHKTPSDIPGKAVITRLVTLPPNEAIPPRTHNDAAVTDLVFRGACLNQMNDEEPVVYREGETFYELPGCHQVRCEISCEKEGEEAEFFAVMVVE